MSQTRHLAPRTFSMSSQYLPSYFVCLQGKTACAYEAIMPSLLGSSLFRLVAGRYEFTQAVTQASSQTTKRHT